CLSSPLSLLLLLFYSYSYHRFLHSFPTRRSSDLSSNFVGRNTGSSAGDTPLRTLSINSASRREIRAWVGPYPISAPSAAYSGHRSEEHTSELQSLTNLVCRLLLEKKNIHITSLRV